jgi:cytochrome b561
VLLYALMFAMPLIGWGMLSAGGYPIVLVGGLELPPILGHDPLLYATLRRAHTIFAFGFYGLFLLHMAAALRHGLIKRDGVFESMASLKPGRD